MISLRQILLPAVLLALLSTACGGNSEPPPGGGGPGGPPGTSGQIVGYGTGYIHTFDLVADASWRQRVDYSSSWSEVSVAPGSSELLIAHTSGDNPVSVRSYSLDTFALQQDRAFVWPDSEVQLNILQFAASTDGRYLAIYLEHFGQRFLEIVDRDSGDIVYRGEPPVDGRMAWTQDQQLIMPLVVGLDDAHGVIVRVPLEEFENSSGGNFEGEALAIFTAAQWGPGVSGLALSHDDSQLVFNHMGDLWLLATEPGSTPHQLTVGPISVHNAAFSPDGEWLVAASGGTAGRDETYVIPVHHGEPILLEHGAAGDEYLLEENTLVKGLLLWQE